MKLIYLSYIIIFSLSANLFSWQYNCQAEEANLFFDEGSVCGEPILILNYKNRRLSFAGEEVEYKFINTNTVISADYKSDNISIELIQIKPEDEIIEFESNIILKNGLDLGDEKKIKVTCMAQRVIF